MEQRSLHPIAVPARRNSSGQREQKNRRNKNEETLSTYHTENIIFGDCDSGADTSRESTKYCLPHGSDQQCAHVRTAAPLNFSFYPPGGGTRPCLESRGGVHFQMHAFSPNTQTCLFISISVSYHRSGAPVRLLASNHIQCKKTKQREVYKRY